MHHLRRYGAVYLTLLVIVVFGVLYFYAPDFREFADRFWEVAWSFNEERNAEFFSRYGLAGAILIVFFMVLQMFLIVFPTWLPMIAAVLAFGPVRGFIISVIAVFTASTLGYFMGTSITHMTGRRFLVEKKMYQRVSELMRRYGFGLVVLFRISPFLSNDAISFVAGIMRMGYRKFIAATLVGIVPLAVAIAWVGRDTETLKTGLIYIGGAGVLLYLIYVYLQMRKSEPEGKE